MLPPNPPSDPIPRFSKMADQSQDATAAVVPAALADEDFVEADDGFDSDSAYGGTDRSDTDSITSSIYAGFLENGRKYQTLREGEYWGPSDDKQVGFPPLWHHFPGLKI